MRRKTTDQKKGRYFSSKTMEYTIYSPKKAKREERAIVNDLIATGLTALAIIVYGVFFAIL